MEKNKSFFADNDRYAERVRELETYRNIRRVVDERIVGIRRLLDIGNGGVFDYDTRIVPEIVGVDLFLDERSPSTIPPNVTFRRGDALALDEPDGAYDGVLMMFVLHHLVSTDVPGTLANLRCAIAEARRVLDSSGRFVIVESCVSPGAFAVEKRLFGALRAASRHGLISHPPTLQLPPLQIAQLLREQFADVSSEEIPVGRTILQFGHRWPAALTPARPFLFEAR